MKKFLLSFFVLLSGASAYAVEPGEPVRELSLEDAVAYALQHNATLKNARIDIDLQRQKNREITGIALPQINGSGQFTYYIKPITSFVPAAFFGGPEGTFAPVIFTPKFGNTAGINGSQILFDGQVFAGLQARKALITLAEQSAQLSTQDVRYNVIRAYYGLVVAYRQFAILKESLNVARAANSDVRTLRDEGFAEKIDVDRSTVQLNNLQTDSIRISNFLETNEQLLKFNMSMPADQPIVLTDTSLDAAIEQSTQLLSDVPDINARLELQLLQSQRRLGELDLLRQRNSRYPTLAAFGNVGYLNNSNTFGDLINKKYYFQSFIGLQLNVPIFNGFATRARIRQAELSLQKTSNQIDQARLGLDFQANVSRISLRNAVLTLASQQRNQELAISVLDLARRKYKAGVGSNLEVTQAQGDLLQAQNAYFTAMLEVINAQTDVQRATGTLQLQASSSSQPLQDPQSSQPSQTQPMQQPGQPLTNPQPVTPTTR